MESKKNFGIYLLGLLIITWSCGGKKLSDNATTNHCTDISENPVDGLSLAITNIKPSYSLAETKDVLQEMNIQVNVSNDIKNISVGGNCFIPDEDGLLISGGIRNENGISYSIQDVGLCRSSFDPFSTSIKAGKYQRVVSWQARNYHGPSDTSMAPGDPFPKGKYQFFVQMAGMDDASKTWFTNGISCTVNLE